MTPPQTTHAQRRALMKRDAARSLRNDASKAERILWSYLRGKKFGSLKLRRQQAIGPYVVDFYCSELKPVVELDGKQHGEDKAVAYDAARDKWLLSRGFGAVRILNHDFLADTRYAIEVISHAVKERVSPLPEALRASTLPQGEGGKESE
jgi:very-short-patch-repair endonuclease